MAALELATPAVHCLELASEAILGLETFRKGFVIVVIRLVPDGKSTCSANGLCHFYYDCPFDVCPIVQSSTYGQMTIIVTDQAWLPSSPSCFC